MIKTSKIPAKARSKYFQGSGSGGIGGSSSPSYSGNDLYHTGNANLPNIDWTAKDGIFYGDVGIGTDKPRARLDVMGAIMSSGDIVAFAASDSEPPGGGSGGGASTLDELIDVIAPNPSAGDLLMYNGDTWVNVSSITITAGKYSII